MHSKIYVGQVSHSRHRPERHHFTYKTFMMYLDLDELPTLFDRYLLWSSKRFNLAYFDRSKHVGDNNKSLKASVQELVYQKTAKELSGPVRLLTNMTYFGYGFNPVSFYYCFDKSGDHVEAIVAEVTNTPWGEQYCYVLPSDKASNDTHIHELVKEFHVSPFNPMDHHYWWSLNHPGERLDVHMKNYSDNQLVFDAALSLREQSITHPVMAKILLKFPFMTMKIIFAIYYEALKLWLKKVPVYDHPDKNISPLTKK